MAQRVLGGRALGIGSRFGAQFALSLLLICGAGCAAPDERHRALAQPEENAASAAAATTARLPTRANDPALPSRDRPTSVRLASLPEGDLPFDCAPIRAAIAAERTAQQWALDADLEAQRMLDEVPHQYIAPDLLVEFLMPPVGHGRPTIAAEVDQFKQIVRMKLCDKLYREIVSRQFAARYPAYR